MVDVIERNKSGSYCSRPWERREGRAGREDEWDERRKGQERLENEGEITAYEGKSRMETGILGCGGREGEAGRGR